MLSLHDPVVSELFNVSIVSSELDGVRANIKRWKSKGKYDRGRVVKSVKRFVVEPAAIALAASKSRRWFELYPDQVRELVADRIVRCEEREVGGPG